MTELMTHPTPLPHVDVTRRPADERDTGFERELFADSRDDLWLLPGDTRDVIVDMQFRAQRRAWRLAYPDARYEMLLVRSVRAGHVVVAEDATDMVVVDVVVRPGLRGLGIGTDLVAELIDTADSTSRTLRTRVCTSNHGARRFFERSGFVFGGAVAGCHELHRPQLRRAA